MEKESMKLYILFFSCLFIWVLLPAFSSERPVNIAHRGACGYLPEHTLAAKALAYGMNADFIEQDLVLTKDDVPLVIHDIHLDTVTDVAVRFPDRKREDGRFYVIDFTFEEIKTLNVSERFKIETSEAVFKKRFPLWKSSFRLNSFQEEIEMIQGLNHATGKNTGIYPEIKEPAWHHKEGKDISKTVLKVLADYGYKKAEDNVFLQCFDFDELKRIKNDLKCELKLIQLLEEDCDLKEITCYAYGIGPSIKQIIKGIDDDGKPVLTDLVKRAKELHLQVHPYTFRIDALPTGITSEMLLDTLFKESGVNGIFSDFPDVSGLYINRNFIEKIKTGEIIESE